VLQERQGGSDQTRSKTTYAYDIVGKQWQWESRHNADGTQSTEYSWLELDTGQITGRRKPQQHASGSGSSARSYITYDAYQVHVASTENELHQTVYTEHDLGTGALLRTRGPNVRPCGPSCEEWEETRTEIDGFGRPVRVYANLEDPATGRWESKLIQRFTYFDAEQLRRVREERRIDPRGTDEDWVTTDTTFDGFGRLRSRKDFRFETGKPDGIETFRYDNEGRLDSFSTPDPSQDTSATVAYSYAYNSLGEIVSVVRPDQSGIKWSRNGLRTTRSELADSGPLAETTTTHDVFDRLVQVDERLDDGSLATTTYGYDALDNVTRVTSPDGIVTDLIHDWLGRRTRITRGSRNWRYEYDLNGNLIREIAPVPAGASEAAYTTSIVYDDLDRPSSRLAGVRAVSAADQTAINHGLVTYTYDEGVGGKGHLTRVASKDSVWTRGFTYDARGQVTAETLAFDLEPALGVPIADSRTQHRNYSGLGQVADQWHGDGLDQGTSTHTQVSPNDRGLPAAIVLFGDTPSVHAIALHNAAGVMTSLVSKGVQTWTHDVLGRVTRMEARSSVATPPVQISEDFTYLGMDDTASLTTFRHGLGAHEFTFDYDRRHQLVGASSNQEYEALFSYTRGGRLATAYVDAPAGAPLALPRDVTYEYAGTQDPDSVGRLRGPNA